MRYEVPEHILDNLAIVESSGNPKAIGRPVKKADGTYEQAQGLYQFLPSTTKSLEKQGHAFDPLNPQQARQGAKIYLGQLLERHDGDLDKALADYGGFKTKDPSAYIQKVRGDQMTGTATKSSFDALFDSALDTSVRPSKSKSFDELFDSALPFLSSDVPKVITPELRAEQEEQRQQTQQEGEIRFRDQPLSVWGGIKEGVGGVTKAVGGLAETGLTLGTGLVGSVAGPAIAIGNQILNGGTQQEAAKRSSDISQALTYEPRTEYGQEILGAIARGAEVAKIPPYLPIIGNVNAALAGRSHLKYGKNNLLTGQAQTVQGGSVGAQGVPIRARVDEAISRASPDTIRAVIDKPLKDVDYKAIDRQNIADKFGYKLTEGQSRGNINLRSEEYNFAPQSGELQSRLFAERRAALEKGFTDFRDTYTSDISKIPNAHNGQMLIDDIQVRFKPVLDDEAAKWAATKEIFGNQIRYNSEAFSRSLNAELKRNGLTYDVPDNIKSLLRDFTESNVSDFDQYDAMRSVLARIQRSASADGNVKQASYIIHKQLNDLDFQTKDKKAKAVLDAAKKATREKYAFLERNPLVKTAIDDPRTPAEIAQGILHPAADNIIARNILGTSDKASTNQTQHLVKFLKADETQFGDRGLQALRSAVVNEFEAAGFGKAAKDEIFKTQAYITALDNPKLNAKYQTIFDGKQLQDLADIGAFAHMTDPVPKGGHSNVSGSLRGDLSRYAATIAEQAINLKTAGIGGTVARSQLQKLFAQRRIKRALEPAFTYEDVNLNLKKAK